jgi:surfeit locus 1 family protein
MVAVVTAAVCVRLGVWQLQRLAERRGVNTRREARIVLPPVDLTPDSTTSGAPWLPRNSLLWRRVKLHGTYDFGAEIVVRGRTHLGAPGVHVVTPLRLGSGVAVPILRGWLPAADGLNADLAAAREMETDGSGRTALTGLAVPGRQPSPTPARRHRFGEEEHLVLGSLSLEEVGAEVSYRIADFFVQPLEAPAEAATNARSSGLQHVPLPSLGGGPHLMYAVQWFSFALISLVGAGLYIRSRTSASGSAAASLVARGSGEGQGPEQES